MHAIVVRHPGGPEVLEYTTVPKPVVKPGWSRIKVEGFGINRSEIFTRQGDSPSVKFPRILGSEVSGIIDVSTDTKLHPGQRVVSLRGKMGRDFDGSYAEYVLVPNDQIYPVTTTLTPAQLAAVPETYCTAFGIFNSLQLKADDRVLIRSATSGVGVAVIKLIQSLPFNITITGTTRNPRKRRLLQQLHLDKVLVIEDPLTLPGSAGQFDKIVDLVGPTTMADSFSHLAEYGILSSTGKLGGQMTLSEFDPIFDIPNNRYLTGFYSGNVTVEQMQQLITYIEDHQIDVTPAKIFDLAHTREAQDYLAQSSGIGKVVVLI